MRIRTCSKAVGYVCACLAPALGIYGCASSAEDVESRLGSESQALIGEAGATGIGEGGAVSVGGSIGTGVAGKGGALPVAGSGGSFGVGGSFPIAGSGGIFGDAGSGGGIDPEGPVAFWHFDDCSVARTTLADSSFNAFEAKRSASTACAVGIHDQGIGFDSDGDFVESAGSSSLSFESNLGVAAWVKPDNVTDTQTIVQKAGSAHQVFKLRIVNKRIELSVELRNGTVFTSSAPLKANRWSHVAGVFDGTFLFLFLDGQQVGQVSAKGRLREASGKVRIGNDGSASQFKGVIDEVWLSDSPNARFELSQLLCFSAASKLTFTPKASGVVATGTPVDYTISVKNEDAGLCGARSYNLSFDGIPQGFEIAGSNAFASVPPGKKATFPVTVTGSIDADPGRHDLPFTLLSFSNQFEQLSGSLRYDLAEPTGCHVSVGRELMIKGVSVVDDPVRTAFSRASTNPKSGAWSFGGLLRNLAPTPADAPEMAQRLFQSWLTNQTVNGFTLQARPFIQQLVLDQWPRTADGKLDLERAPLRLLSIVNRLDVRNLDQGNAGEGRFVFGVLSGDQQIQFTIILEYRLPATTEADVLDWANRWHALAALPFPSEQYNVALQALTDLFTARNAEPGRRNGSALGQLRSDEIALGFPWELREFTLGSDGFLTPTTIKLTPDDRFNGTSTLASFINANAATIKAEKHVVPNTFAGQAFLGGSTFNFPSFWSAPGVTDNEARHKFSLNTCSGCHGTETGTAFLQVSPREVGQEAALSGFLTGISVSDPVTGNPRSFADLSRRRTDLEGIVCTSSAAKGTAARIAAVTSDLRHGTRQTH